MAQLSLLELQKTMKDTVLGVDAPASLSSSFLEAGSVAAEKRMQIHQNNYRQSLVGALGGIFPATKAFVGDAFIEGALGEFVIAHPPFSAALTEYGEGFPGFFKNHRASKALPYIVDLLRLEWALHSLQQVDEVIHDAKSVEDVKVSPNARIIDSDYPLMSLWSVATGQLPPEAVHIDQGGQTVVAVLVDGEVRLLSLSNTEIECLQLIGKGQGVGEHKALQGLIDKSVIVPN